jgi:hypothetical protein
MVSSRQRRIKAHRKAKDLAMEYIANAMRKIKECPDDVARVLEIRRQSFQSLPVDMQKEIGASVARDKANLNSEADMPGQVGAVRIGAGSCKDIYAECFLEDLEWASEMIRR